MHGCILSGDRSRPMSVVEAVEEDWHAPDPDEEPEPGEEDREEPS